MLVGLLTMSTGLLTKVKLFVRGCFYKSSSCCLGLFEQKFSWGVLTKKDKIGSDWIGSDWIRHGH